jgi:hypothetical protein
LSNLEKIEDLTNCYKLLHELFKIVYDKVKYGKTVFNNKIGGNLMDNKGNKAPVIEVTFSPNNSVSKARVEEVEFVVIDGDEKKEED